MAQLVSVRLVGKLAGFLCIILVFVAGATCWFGCPCGYIPGGPLSGDQFPSPDSDWSFVNDLEAVPLCQIEVDFLIPRSMNVNCMSSGGDLFVSCSQCAGKHWSARALAYPEGKVLAAGRVYAIVG